MVRTCQEKVLFMFFSSRIFSSRPWHEATRGLLIGTNEIIGPRDGSQGAMLYGWLWGFGRGWNIQPRNFLFGVQQTCCRWKKRTKRYINPPMIRRILYRKKKTTGNKLILQKFDQLRLWFRPKIQRAIPVLEKNTSRKCVNFPGSFSYGKTPSVAGWGGWIPPLVLKESATKQSEW